MTPRIFPMLVPRVRPQFTLLLALLTSVLLTAPASLRAQTAGNGLPPGVEVPPELADFMRQALAATQAEAAANDKIGGKWRGVPRITGQATVLHDQRIDEPGFSPSLVHARQEEATVRFHLERDDLHGTQNLFWRAKTVDLAGGVSGQSMLVSGDAHVATTEQGRFRGPARDANEITLSLDTETGRWEMVTPGFVQEPYAVEWTSTGQRSEGSNWVGVNETESRPDDRIQSFLFEGTIPDQPGVVTAGSTIEGLAGGKTTRPHRKTGRITFWPEFDDYALEVTIEDYAAWRPLGSLGAPGQPGSFLTAKAVVVPKGSSPPATVRAIRFQLLDVSREPGVCMNFPLGATDRDPDLKLAPAPECPATPGTEGQTLEVSRPLVDPQRRPYALGRIESYDFGARATLRVTCELIDGRELVGEYKGEGAESAQDLVRLPKTDGPDWIAASWKQENGLAELADATDDEKVEGQQYDGDGYTLYEEYRGWVVNGERIEGDPRRKDFFVLNLIGMEARKGIALFEQVSQLRVHSRLRRSEMSETTRLMNGNHRDAPQRVKQHGVWIKTFASPNELGGTGAFTRLGKAGVSGRPGIVDGIGLLPRDHPKSEFNQPHNLPRFFSLLAYDRAIAHELLHSVGVEHHGEGDGSLAAKWVSPRNARNRVGRPYFREMLGRDDSVLTLLNEQGHDLAAQYMESYAKDREFMKSWFWDKWIAEGKAYIAAREGMELTWDTPEKYAEFLLEEIGGLSLFGGVGVEGGQHAGGQDCIMRYYFARFYPAADRDGTYYLVTEGTEPFGLELCRSRDGTGVNAPGHRPQSRYGAAGKNGGDCFSQICPNDAIPPKRL